MAHQNTPPKTLHRRNPGDSCRAGDPCATCRPYSNMVSPELSDNGADFILNNSFYKTCPADVKAEVKSKRFTPEEKKDVQEVLGKMSPLMQCPNPKLKHIGRTTKAIDRDTNNGVCDPDVLGGAMAARQRRHHIDG